MHGPPLGQGPPLSQTASTGAANRHRSQSKKKKSKERQTSPMAKDLGYFNMVKKQGGRMTRDGSMTIDPSEMRGRLSNSVTASNFQSNRVNGRSVSKGKKKDVNMKSSLGTIKLRDTNSKT